MLILLAAACLVWVAILTGAFMAFSGSGVGAGWIFAGALVLALAVWVVVMFREFLHALGWPEVFQEDEEDEYDLCLSYETRTVRSGYRQPRMRQDRMLALEEKSARARRMKGLHCSIRPRRSDRPNRTTPR